MTTKMPAHPFSAGIKARGITRRHLPLIWGCMLGTVYARDPNTGKVTYCDYDWDRAQRIAKVTACTDLRKCRSQRDYGYEQGPRTGQMALWGVAPAKS